MTALGEQRHLARGGTARTRIVASDVPDGTRSPAALIAFILGRPASTSHRRATVSQQSAARIRPARPGPDEIRPLHLRGAQRDEVFTRARPRRRRPRSPRSRSSSSGRASEETSTIVSAGYGGVKYLPRSSTILPKFAMSVRKIVTLTTFSRLEPPACSTRSRLAKTCSAWRSKSPAPTTLALRADRGLAGDVEHVADAVAEREPEGLVRVGVGRDALDA